jgi:hypothetical protein
MSRKSTSKKTLQVDELLGILSDTIRNVNNKTVKVDEANAIAGSARTMCQIVKTQMQVRKFTKENPKGVALGLTE